MCSEFSRVPIAHHEMVQWHKIQISDLLSDQRFSPLGGE